MVPVAVVSNIAGIWLVRRTPEVLFYRITNVLVLLIGIDLTRQGVTQLFF